MSKVYEVQQKQEWWFHGLAIDIPKWAIFSFYFVLRLYKVHVSAELFHAVEYRYHIE